MAEVPREEILRFRRQARSHFTRVAEVRPVERVAPEELEALEVSLLDGAAGDEPIAGAAPVPAEGVSEGVKAHLRGLIEALVFASEHPMTLGEIAKIAKAERKLVKEVVTDLVAHYRDRGLRLDEVGGGYAFRTNVAYAPFIRDVSAKKPVKMSRAQLETLALVAYRQPVTRPEIDDVRGVDSGAALKSLLERDMVRILGKKEEPGRPMLYGTTSGFLEFFGLKNLGDLPTLREFTELSDESRRTYEREMGEDAPDAGVAASAVPGGLPAEGELRSVPAQEMAVAYEEDANQAPEQGLAPRTVNFDFDGVDEPVAEEPEDDAAAKPAPPPGMGGVEAGEEPPDVDFATEVETSEADDGEPAAAHPEPPSDVAVEDAEGGGEDDDDDDDEEDDEEDDDDDDDEEDDDDDDEEEDDDDDEEEEDDDDDDDEDDEDAEEEDEGEKA